MLHVELVLLPLCGLVVGKKYVGSLGQFVDHFLTARRGDVDTDAALTPVGMLHQRMTVRIDLDATHVEEAALGITAQRVLDFEDVRAPVGENRARRGDERELCKLEDSKALHYLDHFSH